MVQGEWWEVLASGGTLVLIRAARKASLRGGTWEATAARPSMVALSTPTGGACRGVRPPVPPAPPPPPAPGGWRPGVDATERDLLRSLRLAASMRLAWWRAASLPRLVNPAILRRLVAGRGWQQ